MKTELKVKLLQHLSGKKKEQGFTLIELLVVIIIIGILSAIALPSFLNQANKARAAGAKQGIGAVNRAQQAYRLENPTFATELAKLGIGDPSTKDYKITVVSGSADLGASKAVPEADTDKNLIKYAGCVTQADGTTAAEIKENTDSCVAVPEDSPAEP